MRANGTSGLGRGNCSVGSGGAAPVAHLVCVEPEEQQRGVLVFVGIPTAGSILPGLAGEQQRSNVGSCGAAPAAHLVYLDPEEQEHGVLGFTGSSATARCSFASDQACRGRAGRSSVGGVATVAHLVCVDPEEQQRGVVFAGSPAAGRCIFVSDRACGGR